MLGFEIILIKWPGRFFFIVIGTMETSDAPSISSMSNKYPNSSPDIWSMFVSMTQILCFSFVTFDLTTLKTFGKSNSLEPHPYETSSGDIIGANSRYSSHNSIYKAQPVGVASSLRTGPPLN